MTAYKSIFLLLILVTNFSYAKPIQHEHRHKVIHKQPIKMVGVASWYGYESGKRYKHKPKTASGEYFNPHHMTAAHKSLPFGTKVKVTNLVNHKSVIVTINDRGPFIKGRIIDLSKYAAKSINMDGTQKVSLKILS